MTNTFGVDEVQEKSIYGLLCTYMRQILLEIDQQLEGVENSSQKINEIFLKVFDIEAYVQFNYSMPSTQMYPEIAFTTETFQYELWGMLNPKFEVYKARGIINTRKDRKHFSPDEFLKLAPQFRERAKNALKFIFEEREINILQYIDINLLGSHISYRPNRP